MSKTGTIKLSTNLLSISCAIRLISFLMMSSLISELFSQNLSFRYPLRRKRGYLKEKKPWPSYSQDLNSPDYFLRGYLLWKQSTVKTGHHQKRNQTGCTGNALQSCGQFYCSSCCCAVIQQSGARNEHNIDY